MLSLRIFRAGHLPATSIDGSQSDPYVLIYCNNKQYRTLTKWGTLHPRYDESFEIDVTNPAATVKLEVRDFPKLPIPMNKGTYLGQLTLTLGHFADGWPVRKVYQLRGFDKLTGMDKIEKFDRGEKLLILTPPLPLPAFPY